MMVLGCEGLVKAEGSSPSWKGIGRRVQWLEDWLCTCSNDSPLYLREREGEEAVSADMSLI